jgi:hypothetical protein
MAMFGTSKIFVMAAIIVTLAAINTAWSVWTLSQREPLTPGGQRIKPYELMVNAKGLPTTKFVDHTFVFQ